MTDRPRLPKQTLTTERAVRAAVGGARRIVVKIGSSSLSSAHRGLDDARLASLVAALSDIHETGRDIVLISSGAIAAGLKPLGLSRRPRDVAHQQAAAAVGQGLLIERYTEMFAHRDIRVGQVLLTPDDVAVRDNYHNALRALGTLLRMGVLPVVNENDTVATQEIRFGDNDRLAALVAQLVRADALVILSDVDALYTSHPDDPDAQAISFVPDVDELRVDTHRIGSAVGTGGMTTKVQAAQLAASAGIPVLLAQAGSVLEALQGGQVGTAFAPVDHARPRRLLWLAYASRVKGCLTLDDGAVNALTKRKASLLAAGVTGVRGDFKAGDPVEVAGPGGDIVARGLVNYSSRELPAMLGKNSSDLGVEMGEGFDRAVVHRDMLVLMNHPGV